jgi:hypothetical protein
MQILFAGEQPPALLMADVCSGRRFISGEFDLFNPLKRLDLR